MVSSYSINYKLCEWIRPSGLLPLPLPLPMRMASISGVVEGLAWLNSSPGGGILPFSLRLVLGGAVLSLPASGTEFAPHPPFQLPYKPRLCWSPA